MVNPVDVQAMVVRAVDSVQSVSQVQNAPFAAQHVGLFENLQRIQQQMTSVQRSENVEQKNVQNSLEGGNRGAYTPFRRGYAASLRVETASRVRDDKRGLILDVRL